MQDKIDIYFGILAVMLAFTIIASGFIIAFLRYQKRIKQKQQELHNSELKHKEELISTSIKTSEEERIRIAKDIHDEIGGIFSTLLLSVNQMNTDEQNGKHIETSKKIIQAGINSVRRISHSIVPFELEILGFKQTLENYLDTVESATGKTIVFDRIHIPEILPSEISLALYRIIQELVSNSLKHGKPDTLFVDIFNNNETNRIHLTYKDNGSGVDNSAENYKDGIGLKNIESRIISLNGQLEIETALNKGYACNIIIPLKSKKTAS